MVCGTTLKYLEQGEIFTCSQCEREFTGHVFCPNGHFVCEECHNNFALHEARKVFSTTTSTNPVAIYEEICQIPDIPMLGCHHAYMAAGALITAIKNEGSHAVSEEMVEEVLHRCSQQAIGGYCGLTGVCGIAPGLGACFAVLSGSKCGKDKEQKWTMELVAKVVTAIADLTGPSCCMAYARKSLEIAREALESVFQITLPSTETPVQCEHPLRHPHQCREEKCPYYKK